MIITSACLKRFDKKNCIFATSACFSTFSKRERLVNSRPASALNVARSTLRILHNCRLKYSRDGKTCVFTPSATFNTLDERLVYSSQARARHISRWANLCVFYKRGLKHVRDSRVCSNHKRKLKHSRKERSSCIQHKRMLETLRDAKACVFATSACLKHSREEELVFPTQAPARSTF